MENRLFVMRRVIYQTTTGWSFFRCAVCNSAVRTRAAALPWLYANRCCCNIGPLVEGCRRGACAERKSPKNQGADLPLASSGTLRSCLGWARAFLTRRNHLSAPARWVDPNLRFSLIPTSTPPTPVWQPPKLLPFSPTGSRLEIASSSKRNSDLIHSSSCLITRVL